MGTYDLVFKRTDTYSDNEGFLLLNEGKEFVDNGRLEDARSKFVQAIEFFKINLKSKPHCKLSRNGIKQAWEVLLGLYFYEFDYIEALEGKQSVSIKGPVFAFSHLKTAMLDLLEEDWKKQCNGKYGGEKPLEQSWKTFYFHCEKQRNTLRTTKKKLKWAVENGHFEYLIFLLKKEKKINLNEFVEKKEKSTLLEYAIRNLSIPVMTILLDDNVNVNIRGRHMWTPLFWAVRSGSKEAVELLLGKGAKVNVKDEFGMTPLHLAAKRGSLEIARLLLKKKAKVNTYEKRFQLSPLELAAYFGHDDIVAMLINAKGNIAKRDQFGRTILNWAIYAQRLSLIQLLIKNGADLTGKDNLKRTPLHWASQSGHLDILNLILENKVDVNAKDMFGDTPMIIAAFFGHNREVSVLFEHGAR